MKHSVLLLPHCTTSTTTTVLQLQPLALCVCRDNAATCGQHSHDANRLRGHSNETCSHPQVRGSGSHARQLHIYYFPPPAAAADQLCRPSHVGHVRRRELTLAEYSRCFNSRIETTRTRVSLIRWILNLVDKDGLGELD